MRRAVQKSLLLFGEGKSEAVFLSHIRALYRSELSSVRVNIDAGQGGSPSCVAERLIRKHLNLKSPDGALLLLDADIEIEAKLKVALECQSVNLQVSSPICLEGLFLSILGDSGPREGRFDASKLKAHFQRKYLKSDRSTEYIAKLKMTCPKLFTKELIGEKRTVCQTLDEILKFLGV